MIHIFSRIIILLFFCFLFISVQSQNNGLTSSDIKKIEKAELKIKKAEAVVDKQEKYTSQIKELEASGSGRVGKIERLQTKANGIVIKSASYFKEGYGQKYKTFRSAVKREMGEGNLPETMINQLTQAHKAYKIGRKWRRKSDGNPDVNKGVEYLFKANGIEKDAIAGLEKAMNNYERKELIPEEENVVAIEIDSTIFIPDTTKNQVLSESPLLTELDSIAPQDTLNQNSLAMDSVGIVFSDTINSTIQEPILEEPVKEELDTYFTIQFLAEKQPVPKEKINSLYDGPFEIVKNEAEGWYRYSFGKFTSLDEAKEMLTKSGVRGYVVAYHNGSRISTREAIDILSGK